uniref:Uncharacterized protein n=1 Tax=Zea mays TaxID=4577 RepID=B4FJH9_MAIZE|nr:unknown [Zea mays]
MYLHLRSAVIEEHSPSSFFVTVHPKHLIRYCSRLVQKALLALEE